MNIIQRLLSRIFPKSVAQKLPQTGQKWDKKSTLSSQVKNMKQYRVMVDSNTLDNAVMAAEHPTQPDRVPLYMIYDKVIKDGHLISQVKKARNSIFMMPYRVVRDGIEDKVASEYFKKPWFFQFLRFCFEAELWGHSLIEVTETKQEGAIAEIKKLALINRLNVRPDSGEVVLYYTDRDGIPYREYKDKLLLLEYFGDEYLGDLEFISKEIIYKRYARTDWAEVSERFGKPFIIIKTASDDEVELNKKEEMAKNFGSSGWAILDDQDEIQLLESKAPNSWEVFAKQIAMGDENNSKILNGETMTSDVGSNGSRSQAEVHERTGGKFLYARLQKFETYINEELLPLMIRLGYPLAGMRFEYPILKEAPEKISPEDNPAEVPGTPPVKKKVAQELQLHDCCSNESYLTEQTLNFNDDETNNRFLPILESIAKRLHEGNLPDTQLDRELYFAIAKEMQSGYERGYGKSILSASGSYDIQDVERFNTIRNNLFAFSGAKSYAQMQALRDHLYENEKLRPLTEVITKAKQINATYNVTYLETEREFVVRAGTMGGRWAEIQRGKSQYPYLKYITAGDRRVRKTHEALDGIVLPVDSPFWNQYYPPNGWNCRCDVEQVSESDSVDDADTASKMAAESVPARFRRNYSEAELFKVNDHPYFKALPTNSPKQLKAVPHYGLKPWDKINTDKLPELMSLSEENFTALWEKIKDRHIDDNNGGFILQHVETGAFAHFITNTLKSDLKKKLILNNRMFGNALEEAIIDPDEIWSNVKGGNKYKEELFTVFVKYYKDKPLAVFVNKENKVDSLYVVEKGINDVRKGVLIHKK